MLSLEQLNQLQDARDLADQLLDGIDTDDWSQTEIEVDPGDLLKLIESWQFMFEALNSLGYFSVVRTEGIKR